MLLSEAQLNEFLGFSREEKLEKLKKQVTEFLTHNKVKIAGEVKVLDKKNCIKVAAEVESYNGFDFGEYAAYPAALYFPDSKCVKPSDPKSVDERWQKLEISNTAASAISSMMIRELQILKRKRREEQEASDQRYADFMNSRAKSRREIEDKVDREYRAGKYNKVDDYNSNGTPRQAVSDNMHKYGID